MRNNAPKDYPMGRDAQSRYARTVVAVIVIVWAAIQGADMLIDWLFK